jgi:hypothetical protein
MTISYQNTMIEALLAALGNIKTTNGFNTNVRRIYRGVRGLDDFSGGDLPGLTVFRETHEVERDNYGDTKGTQRYRIWGFCKVEARSNDYDNLDKFVADVESVLMNETYNTYFNDTFIGTTYFYEGGVQDSFGFFNMEVSISYYHELGDI